MTAPTFLALPAASVARPAMALENVPLSPHFWADGRWDNLENKLWKSMVRDGQVGQGKLLIALIGFAPLLGTSQVLQTVTLIFRRAELVS